ncbi:hypothetical protein [Actinomadura sp. 9N407]|uniref:hypothetical protein n=1 Tax=Actinomadura sp. 9N407 TaxID=3375154 RepID=UPI003787D5B8
MAQLDQTLLELSEGDPVRARSIREYLEILATGKNDLLREMATDILAERIGLREAVSSSVYESALMDGFVSFWSEFERLSPSEQEELSRAGEAHLNNLRAEIDDPLA